MQKKFLSSIELNLCLHIPIWLDTSVGLAPIAALTKYKEVVKDGYELIDTTDENKMQDIKLLERFVSTKEFILGIITGLLSGYLLHLYIASLGT